MSAVGRSALLRAVDAPFTAAPCPTLPSRAPPLTLHFTAREEGSSRPVSEGRPLLLAKLLQEGLDTRLPLLLTHETCFPRELRTVGGPCPTARGAGRPVARGTRCCFSQRTEVLLGGPSGWATLVGRGAPGLTWPRPGVQGAELQAPMQGLAWEHRWGGVTPRKCRELLSRGGLHSEIQGPAGHGVGLLRGLSVP